MSWHCNAYKIKQIHSVWLACLCGWTDHVVEWINVQTNIVWLVLVYISWWCNAYKVKQIQTVCMACLFEWTNHCVEWFLFQTNTMHTRSNTYKLSELFACVDLHFVAAKWSMHTRSNKYKVSDLLACVNFLDVWMNSLLPNAMW